MDCPPTAWGLAIIGADSNCPGFIDDSRAAPR